MSSSFILTLSFVGGYQSGGEGGPERPVVDNIVLHPQEIEGCGIKVAFLGFFEKVLGPHVEQTYGRAR